MGNEGMRHTYTVESYLGVKKNENLTLQDNGKNYKILVKVNYLGPEVQMSHIVSPM